MTATRARCTFALTTVTLLAAGCERPAAETPVRADVAARPSATRVVAERPTRATVRRLAEAPGQIEASESTPIHARISGYVRDVQVDIGSEVKRGQVLAE